MKSSVSSNMFSCSPKPLHSSLVTPSMAKASLHPLSLRAFSSLSLFMTLLYLLKNSLLAKSVPCWVYLAVMNMILSSPEVSFISSYEVSPVSLTASVPL